MVRIWSFWRVRFLGAGLLVVLLAGSVSLCLAEGGEYYPAVKFDPALQAMFQQALEDREAGRISSSIEAFQTILSNQPMLHRARLEMAAAFYQSYNFQEAIKQAERVLEDPNTPANVRVTILAFLAQVKKDAEKRGVAKETWSMPFRVGYIYDTNVNVGPDSQIADIFRFSSLAVAEPDSGSIVSAGLNHNLQTGFDYRMLQNDVALLWQSGLRAYQRNYIEDHRYDIDVYTFRTGPTLLSRGNWRANLNFQGDWIRWGEDDLAFYSYIMPTLTLHVSEALETTVSGMASYRDYHNNTEDPDRDKLSGVYLEAELSAGYTFGKDRLALNGGLKYFNDNGHDDQYADDGFTVYAGFIYRLIYKINVFSKVEWRSRKHFGRAKALDGVYDFNGDGNTNGDDLAPVREEDRLRYTAGLNYTLQEMGWLTDWRLELKGVFTDNEANINAYDYNRMQTYVNLGRTFR